VLPPEAPAAIPYLVLQSSTGSSRVAMSPVGAEFDVRFYGDFSADRSQCFEYLRGKLGAAMSGWTALELQPAFFGLVVVANFSFADMNELPGEFLVSRHTRYEVAPEDLQDAVIRVSARVEDAYFLTLTLSNYETKTIERPVFPGMASVNVKPWEGDVAETGLQLTVDVNNRLTAITRQEDPTVDWEVVDQVVTLVERVAASAAGTFVETGTLNLEELTRETA
jgi:hypothetical protein